MDGHAIPASRYRAANRTILASRAAAGDGGGRGRAPGADLQASQDGSGWELLWEGLQPRRSCARSLRSERKASGLKPLPQERPA
ncbi:hypothetical protein GLE_4251 [Lysobacter enzymogenes]|uniref:Uncharacterized protein n=1 Tax=Lysobacter enzymogenes TaxID=69 RepID=A0A0S2DN89_LYSEN|nr:hypothetical protein GLE_4251 [Lysobacter enzymogenes]